VTTEKIQKVSIKDHVKPQISLTQTLIALIAITKSLLKPLKNEVPEENDSKILLNTDLTAYYDKINENNLKEKHIIMESAKFLGQKLNETLSSLTEHLENGHCKFYICDQIL
jgi:hypothetical protein